MNPALVALLPLIQPGIDQAMVSLQQWADSKIGSPDLKIVADAGVAFIKAVVDQELQKLSGPQPTGK